MIIVVKTPESFSYKKSSNQKIVQFLLYLIIKKAYPELFLFDERHLFVFKPDDSKSPQDSCPIKLKKGQKYVGLRGEGIFRNFVV